MSNFENFKANQLNVEELNGVIGGGNIWRTIRDTAIGVVVEEALRAAGDAIVDHLNSGGGHGGAMDRHGKL